LERAQRFERLTRFERVRLLSARALQLAMGAPPLVKAHHADSVYDVALSEFNKKILPLVVVRRFPNGRVERVEIE
jgi:DNA-directed RNA polymerase subunit K/omega